MTPTEIAIKRIEDLPLKDRQELDEWLDNLDRHTVILVADNKASRFFFNDEQDANNFVTAAEKAHNVQVAFVEVKQNESPQITEDL